jgi:hypothetical protein
LILLVRRDQLVARVKGKHANHMTNTRNSRWSGWIKRRLIQPYQRRALYTIPLRQCP